MKSTHFILRKGSKRTFCGRSTFNTVRDTTNPEGATCLMCRKLAILHDHLKVEDMTDRMHATARM